MPSWAELNKRQQKYLQAVYEVDQAQPAPDMEKSEQFDLLSSTEKGSDHGKEEDQEEEENIPLTERNSSKNTEAALIGWRVHQLPCRHNVSCQSDCQLMRRITAYSHGQGWTEISPF